MTSTTPPVRPVAPHGATAVWTLHPSPVGELLLTGDGEALASLSVPGRRGAPGPGPAEARDDSAFAEVRRQLDAYFAGRLTDFRLGFLASGTEFRQRVWEALDTVPYGTTTTYGALAARIGASRAAVRAVGGAIGANPLLIVRPCHRVIGADGTLTGYAGGLACKQQLLTLEGVLP